MVDHKRIDKKSISTDKLMFSGDFVEQATIIPTTNSTMIVTTALRASDESPVLLPFIETKVAGVRLGKWISNDEADETDEFDIDDFEPLMSVTLPLDNALFYVYDFVRDVQIACTQMANLSGDSIGLDTGRLNIALDFAERLQKQSLQCVEAIKRLHVCAEAAARARAGNEVA